jgi:hypothetical protein
VCWTSDVTGHSRARCLAAHTASETGAWECMRPSPVDIYQNDCWKHRRRERGEQDRSAGRNWGRSRKYACCVQTRKGGRKPSWRISGWSIGEGLILPESTHVPAVVVGEVGGGPGHRNRDVDLRVEAGAVLGDPDESIRVSGRYGQLLKVVCVLVDVVGALKI